MTKTLDDLSWDPYRIAIIGTHGSGKTRLASTAPGKQYWFCFEQGLMSLKGIPNLTGRISYDNYPSLVHDPTKAGLNMDAAMKQLDILRKDPPDVVVSDSLLSMSDCALASAQRELGMVGKPPKGYDVWGLLGSKGLQFLAGFFSLPCSKILISHESFTQNEETGAMEYTMAAKGRMINDGLPREFDEVWRTVMLPGEGGKSVYKVQTQGGNRFRAKSRWDCFDQYEDPNIDKMLEKVKAKFDNG